MFTWIKLIWARFCLRHEKKALTKLELLSHICIQDTDIHLNVSWNCSTESRAGLGRSQHSLRCTSGLSVLFQETTVIALQRPLGWSGFHWDTICSGVPHNCFCGMSLWRAQGQVVWSWQLVLLSEVTIESTAWAVFQIFLDFWSHTEGRAEICIWSTKCILSPYKLCTISVGNAS